MKDALVERTPVRPEDPEQAKRHEELLFRVALEICRIPLKQRNVLEILSQLLVPGFAKETCLIGCQNQTVQTFLNFPGDSEQGKASCFEKFSTPHMSATLAKFAEGARPGLLKPEHFARAGMPQFDSAALAGLAFPLGRALMAGGGKNYLLFLSPANSDQFSDIELELIDLFGKQIWLNLEHRHQFNQMEEKLDTGEKLLSIAAHDLRAPLSIVTMSLELLNDQVKEKSREFLTNVDRIRNSLRRMTRLTSDFLEISRLKSGLMDMDFKLHSVEGLVQEALDEISPLAKTKRISLLKDISPLARSVYCDRNRILQVFSNLLCNAEKFTRPHGEIVLRAHLSPNKDRVVFSVQDNGCGIDEKDLPHIFLQHWRAGQESDPYQEATLRDSCGLGLYIVKTMVEKHGGQVRVRTAKDQGSTFSFDLPVSHKKVTDEDEVKVL